MKPHKFQVHDRVKIVRAGYGCYSDTVGKIVTISETGLTYGDQPGYKIKETDLSTNCNKTTNIGIGELSFELVSRPKFSVGNEVRVCGVNECNGHGFCSKTVDPFPLRDFQPVVSIEGHVGRVVFIRWVEDHQEYYYELSRMPYSGYIAEHALSLLYAKSVNSFDQPAVGEVPGEVCNRNSCEGVLRAKSEYDRCQCSTSNLPCSYCTSPVYCPECDWSSDEPEVTSVYTIDQDPSSKYLECLNNAVSYMVKGRIYEYVGKDSQHFRVKCNVKCGPYAAGSTLHEDPWNFKASTKEAYDAQLLAAEDPLIVEARKRYPVGTKFYPAHLSNPSGEEYCIVTNRDFVMRGSSLYNLTDEGKIYDHSSKYGNTDFNRIVYESSTGKWADVVGAIPVPVPPVPKPPVVDKPESEEDLLARAKQLYPPGTSFISPYRLIEKGITQKYVVTSNGATYVFRNGHILVSVSKSNQPYYKAYIYYKGHWGEIVTDDTPVSQKPAPADEPKCKFQVGDLVVGTSVDRYTVTTKGWKGVVKKVVSDHEMCVSGIGIDREVAVNPKDFELDIDVKNPYTPITLEQLAEAFRPYPLFSTEKSTDTLSIQKPVIISSAEEESELVVIQLPKPIIIS